MIINYDKIILSFRFQKTDEQKYLVYGMSLDFVKQGDYVNVVVMDNCNDKIKVVFCGFVKRIYFGSLANSEISMAFPTEEHTFLILIDNFYSNNNRLALENRRLLVEAESKNGFGILVDFISQSKNILIQRGKSLSTRMSEIKKVADESIKKINSLNIPSTLKNKIVDKVKKLISYFKEKGQKEENKLFY